MRALAVLALLVPVAGAQTTWYVDVGGVPPGSGTPAAPYTSIQYAIDQPGTANGDTLSVAAGTYAENIAYGVKAIDIVGSAGPEQCILQAAVPDLAVVTMDADGCGLWGFTVTGGEGPEGHGVFVTSSCFDPQIQRCLIVRNEGHGVFYKSTDIYGDIIQSTLADNGRSGLHMTLGTTATLVNSIVWHNIEETKLNIGPYAQGGFLYNCIRDPLALPGCKYIACGNFAEKPLFWDRANGDYRLAPGSPCIDAGWPSSPLDPDGSLPDVGALVYDASYAPPPTPYCTSKVNSQGCTPAIAASGSASASGQAFEVTCSNVVNNKTGLLFYGYAPKAAPYQGGWLCVQGPTKRTPVQSSGGNPPPDDCSGVYTYDMNAHILSGQAPGLVPGAMVYAQYWFRDPAVPGLFKTGRSDALSFGIAP